MNADLIREEPPADAGVRSTITPLLMELRNAPGEWFRFPGEYPQSVQSQIRGGLYKGTRPGDFEVRAKRIVGSTPARNMMWVRYIGGTP